MGIFKEMEAEQERHAGESARLTRAIQDEIKALPDNPRIRRFPGNPRAFVIGFKDVGDNLSVEHHDFRFQYEKVAEAVGKAVDPAARLREIVAEGRLVLGRGPKYSVAMHPDVIAALRRLIGGEAA